MLETDIHYFHVSGSLFSFVKAAKYFSFNLSENTLFSYYKDQMFDDAQKRYI
jgi:hypothetical protein